jgi:hypothetical protein
MNTHNEYTRITVTVRKSNLENYRKVVDNPNVSKLLDDTLAEKIAYERRMKAMEELRKLGPAFPAIEDASAYVRAMREEDEERAQRLGI